MTKPKGVGRFAMPLDEEENLPPVGTQPGQEPEQGTPPDKELGKQSVTPPPPVPVPPPEPQPTPEPSPGTLPEPDKGTVPGTGMGTDTDTLTGTDTELQQFLKPSDNYIRKVYYPLDYQEEFIKKKAKKYKKTESEILRFLLDFAIKNGKL